MFVCVHKAFHATPNVYKRKSKEIRIETEPCGVDCFLLQVRQAHNCLTSPCILYTWFLLFVVLCSSEERGERVCGSEYVASTAVSEAPEAAASHQLQLSWTVRVCRGRQGGRQRPRNHLLLRWESDLTGTGFGAAFETTRCFVYSRQDD